jgi:hypothetical protein
MVLFITELHLSLTVNDIEDIIYGRNISILTRFLTVTVRMKSPESTVFLKVFVDGTLEHFKVLRGEGDKSSFYYLARIFSYV